VLAVAAGLRALGVGPGDRVGLVSDGSPHWLEADLAVLALGAADVPRGTDTTPLELGRILDHSGAGICLCVGEVAVARVLAAPREEGASRGPVVRLDGPGDGERVLGREDLLRLGGGPLAPSDLPPGDADAPATLVYTSGTTGRPKGVTLLHRNFLHQVEVLPEALDFRNDDVFLSLLPPWHAYERIIEYVATLSGGEVVFSHPSTLRDHLREVRPTWMAAVPRVWEMILALSGYRRLRVEDPVRAAATLRAALGGNLRVGASGGGSLPESVDHGYIEAGLCLVVGYGLTETGPVLTVRRAGSNRPGTIGSPVRATEVRIVDRVTGVPVAGGVVGVVHARGPQVMAGYWRDPGLTAAVLHQDGWFDTGDLACIDACGDLIFRGRAKETLVLRGGENVEPGPLEDRLRESPYIDQAVVVGNDRKTLAALVVPRRDALPPGADPHGLLVAECERLLSEDAGFSRHERIHRLAVLEEPFTVENGLLTPTQKVRRQEVLLRHDRVVQGLFPEAG
jgi:long-chain acyl-CoA synthetase